MNNNLMLPLSYALGQRAAAFSSEPQYCGLHIIHGVLGEVLLQERTSGVPKVAQFPHPIQRIPTQWECFLAGHHEHRTFTVWPS